MSLFSIDGLSSGLDTTSIIEGLMEVEAIPVRRLESLRDDMAGQIDAWADLDGRLGDLATAIDTITENGGTNVLVGEASNPAVTATATGEGAAGVYEVRVDQIAASQQLMSDRFAGADDFVGAGQVTITSGLAAVGSRSVRIRDLETGHFSIEITRVADGTATIVFNGQEHEVDSDRNARLRRERQGRGRTFAWKNGKRSGATYGSS